MKFTTLFVIYGVNEPLIFFKGLVFNFLSEYPVTVNSSTVGLTFWTCNSIKGKLVPSSCIKLSKSVSFTNCFHQASRRQISFRFVISGSIPAQFPIRHETIELSTGEQLYCLTPKRKLSPSIWNFEKHLNCLIIHIYIYM